MVEQLGLFLLILGAGELLALGVLWYIRRRYGEGRHSRVVRIEETIKGVFERATIVLGLMLGYPGILTMFAALKLKRVPISGNRLSE